MRQLVVFNWDVLARTPDGTLANALPVEGGVSLYKLLAQAHRVVLLFQHDQPEELVRSWLVREGLKLHVSLVLKPAHEEALQWKLNTVRSLRTAGNDELMVVDNDAELLGTLYAEGVPSLLVSYPQYQFSERRLKEWTNVVDEIDHLREARG